MLFGSSSLPLFIFGAAKLRLDITQNEYKKARNSVRFFLEFRTNDCETTQFYLGHRCDGNSDFAVAGEMAA